MKELNQICFYAKDRIDISLLNEKTYISTENMLQNKEGVTISSNIPNVGKTQAYKKGDILISNIRPYFKKIWYATWDGGCSGDVLVIRAKQGISSRYLYTILSDDRFFNYSMASSKGTKMPRGDKESIMKYRIPDFNPEEQGKISKIIFDINDKIRINNGINDNLQQQAFALFEEKFPNIRDGEFRIGDYLSPKRGKNLLTKDAVLGNVPVVAGGLEPSTYHNKSNTGSPVITISASGANAGFVNLWNVPVWSSDSSFIDESITRNVYFWYVLLKKRQKEIYDSQTGSAQAHIYPKHIEVMPMVKINDDCMNSFNELVSPLFMTIGKNNIRNKILSDLRDTLLPKLMSGEIDVSNIKLDL